MYEGLSGNDKAIVDTAFGIVDSYGAMPGASVFVEERRKYGVGTELDFPILMSYAQSQARMKEGILGFYSC